MAKIWWYIILGVIAVVIGVGIGMFWAGPAPIEYTMPMADQTPVSGELQVNDVKVGEGTEAKPGDKVSVHYTGTLTNGMVFDSSKTRGTPFTFTLGAGQVIEGWDKGVVGMKVGGKRMLVIPPQMAYGANQMGPISPNSTLTFEVELLEVK